MPITQENRTMALGTAAGDNVLIPTSFKGHEALSEPFTFEVEAFSERDDVSPDDLLGMNATIRIATAEGEARYFNGFVSSVSQSGARGKLNHARLVLVPWLWFLSRTSDCRIFQNKTVPEIVQAVFREFGFTDFTDRLTGSYRTWTYCVQYRETALDFVSRLMEQEGISYYFEHENGKHTMVLIDSPAKHDPITGKPQIPFLPDTGGEGATGRVFEWSLDRHVQPGAVVLRDYDFENPLSPVQAAASSPASHAVGDMEVFDYPGEYTLEDEGNAYAKVRMDELASRHLIAVGKGDARWLACGRTFKLTDPSKALRPGQTGEFLVVQTAIAATEGGHRSDTGTGEPTYEVSVRAIPKTVQFRPSRTTPKPTIRGPQTAFVVGKSGEEIDADEHGRVKIQFHWDRDGKYDEKSSCWVRVCQPLAGKGWGYLFTPRVGQEVVVEFLEGDPDRPLITGRVFNGVNKPPYSPKSLPTLSTIKTNSSKGGDGFNELRFDDKKDAEQIWMHAQNRLDIRVRGNYYETNYGNREVRVGWEKDGDSGGSLSTYIHKDTNEIVQGAVYEQYEGPHHWEVVTGPAIWSFGDTLSTFVTNACSLNADSLLVETKSEISHKSASILAEATSKGMSLKSGADLNLQAQGKINLKALGGVHLEGTAGVHIKCGGSFVVVTPAGVSVMGPLVNINSGGSASPAGDAKPAEAVKEQELELPFEAIPADDGKPGAVASTGKASPRTRNSRTLKPQPAPPPPPPPPPPHRQTSETKVAPVPVPVSPERCGIASVDVSCQHSRRPGPSRILQVVADTSSSNPAYAIKFLGLSGEKQTGGTDKVQWTLRAKDPAAKDELKWQITTSPGAPGEGGWTKAQTDNKPIDHPANDEFWPIDADPDKHFLHARGCDTTTQRVEIQSFPSQQHKLAVEVERFKDVIDDVNSWFEDHAADLYGIEVFPSITPPKGKFELAWGWKENASDWRAYFLVTGTAAYDPVGGVAINFKVSIPEVIAKVGAQSLGIHPVFLEFIDDAKEYLGDIYIKLAFGAKLLLTGQADLRFWATGEETGDSSIKLELAGEVELEIGAVTNEDFWVAVEVKGQAKTEISGGGMFQIGSSGIEVTPTADFPGIKLTVTAIAKAFSAEIVEGSAEWTPIGPQQLYPPKDEPTEPIKIAGPQ